MSNSAFEVQRSHPVKGGKVREKHDHSSCCCFLPSSRCQTNVDRNEIIKTSTEQCESVSGKQNYHLSKSHSEERTAKITQVDKKLGRPQANHLLSYDGSFSTTVLENFDCDDAYRNCTKPISDKISNCCTSSFTLEPAQAGSNLKSQSSSKTKLHLDISTAQSMSAANRATNPRSPVSGPTVIPRSPGSGPTVTPRSPSSGPTTMPKVCLLDPTKYQLKPSTESMPERRNVPHMGSQRLNVGSSPSSHHQSNSPRLIIEDHIYCNEPLNCQGIPFACGRESVQKGNSNVLESRARSLDDGAGIQLPLSSSTAAGFRSSLASVTRHLSLETPGFRDPGKVQTSEKHENTEKLITWIMNPDDTIPLEASVRMQMNSENERTTDDHKRRLQSSVAVSSSHDKQRSPLSHNDVMRLMANRVTDAGEMKMTTKDHPTYDNGFIVSQNSHQLYPVVVCAENTNWKVKTWMDNNNVMLAMADRVSRPLLSGQKSPKVGADARPSSESTTASKHPELTSQKSISVKAYDDGAFSVCVNSLKKSCSLLNSWNQWPSGVVKRTNSTASASHLTNVTNARSQQASALDLPSDEVDLEKLTVVASDVNGHLLNIYPKERVLKNGFSAEHISDKSLHTERAQRRYDPIRIQSETGSSLCKGHILSELSGPIANPGLAELSQSIANLQNLFTSCDDVIPDGSKAREASDCLNLRSQSSFVANDLTSGSSSETLQDLENEENVFKDDKLSSFDDTKDHSSPSVHTDIPNGRSQADSTFDQNNNQFYDDESDDGWESEYFGTLGSETVDWCYKWEWDSPTSTLQRRIIERPAYRRNDTVIPIVDDQVGGPSDLSLRTNAPDSSPDVILPLIADTRKNRRHNFPGAKICHFVVNLASEDGFFGAMIRNFVQCTMTGIEMNPRAVIRNIRQFIDGLKNYLMQQREKKLNDLIRQECSKINSGEFLNMDAITERALHKCILRPLHGHIRKLFIHEFTRNGNLQLMSDGIKSSQSKLLFKSNHGIVLSCSPKSAEVARHFLQKMVETYSPLKKLENLMSAVSVIGRNVNAGGGTTRWSDGNNLPARTDALLVTLMYILVEHEMKSAEIEADYVWGLVHPSCLTGESIYYLTLFSSAIALVKNLSKTTSPLTNGSLQNIITNGLVKIRVPDEKYDNIWTQTLPFRPNSTATEMRQMMAYKLNITNPQEYGLYLIKDSEEIRLSDTAYLNDFKKRSSDDLQLAYKRINAKFIWPTKR